ncbi:MAG: hypothetical protein N3G21_01615 [Candidatus Hydrogenedentes bacterium]|nr:hypothetical protein [Candidatus Hydrogenedentota bacterium]
MNLRCGACIEKAPENFVKRKFFILSIVLVFLCGFLLFNKPVWTEDKGTKPAPEVKNPQDKREHEGKRENVPSLKEDVGTERSVKDMGSSDSVKQIQPQKKRIPAFWVLLPDR